MEQAATGEPVSAKDADGLRCLLIFITTAGRGKRDSKRWRERIGVLDWDGEVMWFDDVRERLALPESLVSRLRRVTSDAPAAGRADVWTMVLGALPRAGDRPAKTD